MPQTLEELASLLGCIFLALFFGMWVKMVIYVVKHWKEIE